jgi:hypothetical protein
MPRGTVASCLTLGNTKSVSGQKASCRAKREETRNPEVIDTRHQPLRRVEMLAVSTDFCSFRQRQRDLLRPGGRQAKLFFAPLRNKSAKLTPVEVPYLLDSKKSAVPS